MADMVFRAAMAFFRANKNRGGKVHDESGFFKFRGLNRDFERFWARLPSARKKQFKNKKRLLVQRIEKVEWS